MRNPINRESELRALLEELNLDGMAALFTDLALKAAKENLSHEAYLFELAKQEKEQRVARSTARLLRQSIGRLMAIGRWLSELAPEVRTPAQWTEDLALRFRADV